MEWESQMFSFSRKYRKKGVKADRKGVYRKRLTMLIYWSILDFINVQRWTSPSNIVH